MAVIEPAARSAQVCAALARLEVVAFELNSAASWAGELGFESEADMLRTRPGPS